MKKEDVPEEPASKSKKSWKDTLKKKWWIVAISLSILIVAGIVAFVYLISPTINLSRRPGVGVTDPNDPSLFPGCEETLNLAQEVVDKTGAVSGSKISALKQAAESCAQNENANSIIMNGVNEIFTSSQGSGGGLLSCEMSENSDLDPDGIVGITDFLLLLEYWGTDGSDGGDIDEDGLVGITDFLVILGNWGPVQPCLDPYLPENPTVLCLYLEKPQPFGTEKIVRLSTLENSRCSNMVTQCSDGIDNDGDGLIDFGEDTDCVSELDGSEDIDGTNQDSTFSDLSYYMSFSELAKYPETLPFLVDLVLTPEELEVVGDLMLNNFYTLLYEVGSEIALPVGGLESVGDACPPGSFPLPDPPPGEPACFSCPFSEGIGSGGLEDASDIELLSSHPDAFMIYSKDQDPGDPNESTNYLWFSTPSPEGQIPLRRCAGTPIDDDGIGLPCDEDNICADGSACITHQWEWEATSQGFANQLSSSEYNYYLNLATSILDGETDLDPLLFGPVWGLLILPGIGTFTIIDGIITIIIIIITIQAAQQFGAACLQLANSVDWAGDGAYPPFVDTATNNLPIPGPLPPYKNRMCNMYNSELWGSTWG